MNFLAGGRPSGIHIVGKRQGSKPENSQLVARTAMAAALWHLIPEPKPRISYVASDVHGPDHESDAGFVRSALVSRFEVPEGRLLVRPRTNCTFLEVRRVRALSRAYDLGRIVALTHSYHARRTQMYFDEVLDGVTVMPVDLQGLTSVLKKSLKASLFHEVSMLIERSRPNQWDLAREKVVEWLLSRLHRLDPHGRIERRLAARLRPASRGEKGWSSSSRAA